MKLESIFGKQVIMNYSYPGFFLVVVYLLYYNSIFNLYSYMLLFLENIV